MSGPAVAGGKLCSGCCTAAAATAGSSLGGPSSVRPRATGSGSPSPPRYDDRSGSWATRVSHICSRELLVPWTWGTASTVCDVMGAVFYGTLPPGSTQHFVATASTTRAPPAQMRVMRHSPLATRCPAQFPSKSPMRSPHSPARCPPRRQPLLWLYHRCARQSGPSWQGLCLLPACMPALASSVDAHAAVGKSRFSLGRRAEPSRPLSPP